MYFITIKVGKIKFQDKIVIGLALILVIIIFTIIFVSFTSETSQQSQQTTSTLSPTPFASQNQINYVKNSIALSKSDSIAKTKLLSLLPTGDVPGIIYQSSDFSIEYISSADMFLVEIQTANIQSAKDEANGWFLTHGMSQKGICTLPVEFYLSPNVVIQLKNSNFTFNPLPDEC
jgi:hypothetical protein